MVCGSFVPDRHVLLQNEAGVVRGCDTMSRVKMSVSLGLGLAALVFVPVLAQDQPSPAPSARLVSASLFSMPGRVDSNNPMVWTLIEGQWQLSILTSWGGAPS